MTSDDSDTPSTIAMAMVATSSTKLPNAAKIQAALGLGLASKGGFLGLGFGRKSTPAQEVAWNNDSLLSFPCRDAQFAIALMPGPIPWSALEGPCATAWWWPEATKLMKVHRYHFIVPLAGGTIEPVERRVLLTKVVSAIVRDTDAVGVYWCEGSLVHEPSQFLEQALSVSSEDIPGPLWIDVRIEENEDGSLRCFTTGLEPLGFLEIEVEHSTLPADELLTFIGDTACYIVNGRVHIGDGETMGRTATEKYLAQHAASMLERSEVMRLVMT